MTNIEGTSNMSVKINGNLSGDSPLGNFQPYDPITSDDCRRVMNIIFSVAFTGVISILGSAANVINIVVFFKQGFDDSVSISLNALVVSDLCSLLPFVWRSVALNPLFQFQDIDLDHTAVLYLTSGLPESVFNRITCWITAFITFERCVCIALPMKVKDIITPKRTLITVVVMFLILFAIVSPVYATIQLAPWFEIGRNKTWHILLYTSNAKEIEHMSFSIAIFIHLSSFIIVVVCTMILIYNMRIKSQWRHKAIAVSSTNSMSLRDKRVMKMVAMIASIFIVCLLPSTVTVILMIHLQTEFSFIGQYQNTFQVTWVILNMMETINSSTSILVYYNMSSKFRSSFNDLFCISTTPKKEVKFAVSN